MTLLVSFVRTTAGKNAGAGPRETGPIMVVDKIIWRHLMRGNNGRNELAPYISRNKLQIRQFIAR